MKTLKSYVQHKVPLLAGLFATALLGVSTLSQADTPMGAASAARFDANGELIRPTGYREWIYIGAPLTPNDMNDGKAAFPEFHNVYIDPASWEHWKTTGEFRDGTLILKELVSVGSKSSFSGNGYFMGEYIGLEAVVKDKARFSAADGYWGFFRFSTEDHQKLLDRSQVLPSQACAGCHANNAQQDFIFVQHYPVLRAAKARGEAGTGGH